MSEKVFQRKIDLYKDFQRKEKEKNKDIKVSFNVSSGEMSVWIHFDKNWGKDRGLKILNELVSPRTLEMVGYKLTWKILEYKAFNWDEIENTCYR